jgi:hypothetical protein
MPYCQETFNIVKATEKYKSTMRRLNYKSYHKLKEENPEAYQNKLILKQAKYFIKNKTSQEFDEYLKKIAIKQGDERSTKIRETIIKLSTIQIPIH